jgi:hypothetical protein
MVLNSSLKTVYIRPFQGRNGTFNFIYPELHSGLFKFDHFVVIYSIKTKILNYNLSRDYQINF